MDGAGLVDLADHAVAGLALEDVSLRVDTNSDRVEERGARRSTAVAAPPAARVARDRGDGPAGVDAPNSVVAGVREDHIVRDVDCDAVGGVQLRGGRRAAVTCESLGPVTRDGRDDALRIDLANA